MPATISSAPTPQGQHRPQTVSSYAVPEPPQAEPQKEREQGEEDQVVHEEAEPRGGQGPKDRGHPRAAQGSDRSAHGAEEGGLRLSNHS